MGLPQGSKLNGTKLVYYIAGTTRCRASFIKRLQRLIVWSLRRVKLA